jgi:hypothetical protein
MSKMINCFGGEVNITEKRDFKIFLDQLEEQWEKLREMNEDKIIAKWDLFIEEAERD